MGLPVRTEVEYLYRTAFGYSAAPIFTNAAIPTRGSSNVFSQTVFFNGFYDFKNRTPVTPYIGGGLGFAVNQARSTATVIATGINAYASNTRTTTAFAWNLGAGLAYNLSKRLALDLSYRYVDFGKVVWGDASVIELTSKDFTANEFLLGIRWQFQE